MTWSFTRVFIFALLSSLCHLSYATDAYYAYVADFFLHESQQARNPNQVIRYSDGASGVLLQRVLEPTRVKATLNTYAGFAQRGEKVTEVPKLLTSLAVRYEEAFKKEPGNYEKEYLDSLEALIEVSALASQMLNASILPSASNRGSGPDADKEKALMESLQSLAKMARDISAASNKAIASEIRQRVSKGMFTQSGAKRALAIADRVAPQ